MRIAMLMTLTARMVRLYPPEESVTEVVPSRETLKLPDRSPGQDFSTGPELLEMSGYGLTRHLAFSLNMPVRRASPSSRHVSGMFGHLDVVGKRQTATWDSEAFNVA
jgi:hypothetical protein